MNTATLTTEYPEDKFPHLTYLDVGIMLQRATLRPGFRKDLELGRRVRWYIRNGFTYERAAAQSQCEPEWAEICHRQLLAWLEQRFKLVERRDLGY